MPYERINRLLLDVRPYPPHGGGCEGRGRWRERRCCQDLPCSGNSPGRSSDKDGRLRSAKAQANVPVCKVEDLVWADAIIFGTPTRFGNMCGQMRQFLDSTGGLWAKGELVGKVGSVFTSSATQHGGQESTILSFHITLLHQGMIIVGLPYSFAGQMRIDEMTGSSPYGASTIAGGDGKRMPSENELDAARFQGKHVAEIAVKLFR